MSVDQRFSILVTLSIFVIGSVGSLLVYVIKGAMRMARTEERVAELVTNIQKLMDNKERDHAALANSIKAVSESSDRRLRWLEENLWKGRRQ